MESSPQKKRPLRRWFLILLLPVILLAAALLSLSSSSGSALALKASFALINRFTMWELQATEVTGSLYSTLTIGQLVISDEVGVCFEIDDLLVEARYSELFKGRIGLARAEVGKVAILRRPVKKKQWRVPKIPTLVYHVSVEHMEVSRLDLPEAGPGGDHPLALKGQVVPAGKKKLPELLFTLQSLESDAVDGKISFFYDGESPQLEGYLEDSSLLPELLDLSPPLRAVLHGEGPRDHWEAGITVQTEELLLAEGNLLLEEGEVETRISGQGKVFLSHIPPLSRLVPHLGERVEGEGRCRLNTKGEFTLDEARLHSDKVALSATSALTLPTFAGTAEGSLQYRFEEGEAPYELVLQAESDGTTVHYKLSGEQDTQDFLSGDGQLRIGEAMALTGTLELQPGGLPFEAIPFQGEERIHSRFDLGYEVDASKLTIHELSLTGADLESSLSGWVNLDAETFDVKGAAKLTGTGLFQWEEQAPVGGNLHALFTAASQEEKGVGTLHLEGTGLHGAGVTVDSLKMEVNLISEQWRQAQARGWQGDLLLDCSDMTALPKAEEEALSLEDLQLALRVEGQGFETITCPAFTLTSGSATIEGEGLAQLQESQAQLKMKVACPDSMELTAPFADLPSLALVAELESLLSWNPVQGEAILEGRLQKNEATVADVAKWLGNDGLAFDMRLEATDELVTLQEGHVSHALGDLALAATHQLSDQSFTVESTVDAPDLSGVGKLLDQEISGKLSGKAQLSGTVDDFQGTITVDGSSVKVAQSAPLNLALEIHGDGALLMPELQWQGSVKGDGAPLLLAGKGSLGEDRFTLTSCSVKDGVNEATLTGAIPFTVYDAVLQGEVKAPELAQLAALVDFPLSGRGEASLNLADKKLESRAQFQDLKAGSFQGGSITLQARAEGLDAKPRGHARLEMAKLTLGKVELDHVRGEVEGGLSEARLQVDVNESVENGKVPLFTMHLESELSVEEGRGRLTAMAIGTEETVFNLKEAAHLTWAPPEFSLSPLQLVSPQGSIEAEAQAGKEELRATVALSALPLSLLETAGLPPASGQVQAELALLGTWEHPQVKGRVQVEEAHLEDERLGDLPPAQVEATLALLAGRLQLESNVTLDPGVSAEAALAFPLELSLQPWHLNFDEENELTGKLSFESDFQPLLKDVALIPHALEGKMEGEFSVGGTLAQPRISGEALLEEGQYTNISAGTNLHEMRLRLVAADGALRISECQARSGEQGTLTVEGSILLDLENNFPLELTIALDHAQVVHLAYASAVVDGPLSLKGNLKDMLLSGELEIMPVEATMPDQLMLREPPRLEVVEMGQEEEEEAAPSPFADVASSIRLDISCSMPRRIYARAPILDSEWGGLFHVGGTLFDPRAEGRVAVLRGNLDFLNQRFELNDSAILFTGKSITEPTLDMRAQVETKEISATVRLEGELDTIAMKLESSPSLPQDEILSHILFGKDLARISPVQAIQLARVATMFNKDLGGLRFFSGNVSISGIDRIDLRTGEKIDDAAVGLGKYFTDSVYVEVEQGTTSDSGRISVEVELSPQLSIKGDVDARDRSGLGLFWRKDY